MLGARNEIDDTASLFNYIPRGSSPAKGNKSILYKMHKHPRKTLNIVDGGSKYGRVQDVQRFNEEFDQQSVKSLVSLNSKMRPPMTGFKQRMATSQGRIGKTIDYDIGESASQVGGAFDRQSNSAHRRNESANGLREATLRKIANNSRLNRGSLIESIKNMNEDQLHKISKYLKVKIGEGNDGDDAPNYETTGSLIGDAEAEELNDKVEEL